MRKTAAGIAKLKKVSRSAVSRFIKKNGIQPAGRYGKYKTYDCRADPLKSYIGIENLPEPEPVSFELPELVTPETWKLLENIDFNFDNIPALAAGGGALCEMQKKKTAKPPKRKARTKRK